MKQAAENTIGFVEKSKKYANEVSKNFVYFINVLLKNILSLTKIKKVELL